MYRVVLQFSPERVCDPRIERVAGEDDAARTPELVGDGGDAVYVLRETASNLAQCAWRTASEFVEARYDFDEAYARAHPEFLDLEHLRVLHGTLAAKMYDDGVLILDDPSLGASLRWPSVRTKGVRLTRTGERQRRRG